MKDSKTSILAFNNYKTNTDEKYIDRICKCIGTTWILCYKIEFDWTFEEMFPHLCWGLSFYDIFETLRSNCLFNNLLTKLKS